MATDWGAYRNDGSPEGVLTATPGSICSDTTNGIVYRKVTGSGNTGWDSLSTTVAFRARKSTPATNVTGDGTTYIIADYVEDYDIGNNFDPITGIFIAPIDGFYIFNIIINYTGILVGHTLGNSRFNFNPSPPADPVLFVLNPFQTAQTNGNLVMGGTVMVQLSAGINLKAETVISGAAQVIDIAIIEFSGTKLS